MSDFSLEARAGQAISDALSSDPPGLTPHIVAAMRDALQATEDVVRLSAKEAATYDHYERQDTLLDVADAIRRLREAK